MTKAFVFPGQGAQFVGMGNSLLEIHPDAQNYLDKANDILGFDIAEIMKNGSIEDLTQTKVTQPAVFIHSIVSYKLKATEKPDLVAGHSLGEFSALVANETLTFEDALKLVSLRAQAMQKACELEPSTMAAVLGLDDAKVEQVCQSITEEVVVAANYNCPGQLVISGSIAGINIACEKLKEAGAKRALVLKVGGAFHSPLMMPAQQELAEAIKNTHFSEPKCPVVQNYTAQATSDKEGIKANLISQLTAPVRWTQSVQTMVDLGASIFVEYGPGAVLQGLIKKIAPDVETAAG